MPATTSMNLGSVQKTLLLPLWGRAVESKKAHPLLVDPTAVRIVDSIDYDFSTMAAGISFVTQLCWVARSVHIDRVVREFLERHAAATVVNLGCGVDTTFERVDDGKLVWYDLDLPDVIELRTQYVQQGPRRRFIACSILDGRWMSEIEIREGVLFIAAGVLYYIHEEQVKNLFRQLADHFPRCEIAFDACSPRGMREANERVIRRGGMDENARLVWGIERAADLEQWDPRIRVVAEYPIFRGMRSGLTLKEKWGTFLCDVLRIMSMIHLRMANRGESGDERRM